MQEYAFELEDLPAKALVVMRGAVCEPALEQALRLGLPVVEMVARRPGEAGLFKLEWMHNASDGLGAHPSPAVRGHTALVLHTSGTTKLPKIVPLSAPSRGG